MLAEFTCCTSNLISPWRMMISRQRTRAWAGWLPRASSPTLLDPEGSSHATRVSTRSGHGRMVAGYSSFPSQRDGPFGMHRFLLPWQDAV
jgi:hypothetical protein